VRSLHLLEKLLKNFSAIYETRRFITAFTRALHWSISWASLIQSIPSYLSKIHFNIVDSPTSWFSQWSLSFWIYQQYPICILFAPIRATCSAHLILLDFIFSIWKKNVEGSGRYFIEGTLKEFCLEGVSEETYMLQSRFDLGTSRAQLNRFSQVVDYEVWKFDLTPKYNSSVTCVVAEIRAYVQWNMNMIILWW
jgi:hypothetical protein